MGYSNIFELPTTQVARELLGWKIFHETAEGLAGGIIVETEAYCQDDPASHSFNGQTLRNAAMFGEPGRAYVYISYGLHYCLNIVTSTKGKGEAVLIRALQPTEGIPLMQTRRQKTALADLCSGPGKVCQALAITLEDNLRSLESPPLFITPPEQTNISITETPRIGISVAKDDLFRFYIANNPYVSRLTRGIRSNAVNSKTS